MSGLHLLSIVTCTAGLAVLSVVVARWTLQLFETPIERQCRAIRRELAALRRRTRRA